MVSADYCKLHFRERLLMDFHGEERVQTHRNLGCLSMQPSLGSRRPLLPNVTQITMSSGGIENINGNEVKESSSEGI